MKEQNNISQTLAEYAKQLSRLEKQLAELRGPRTLWIDNAEFEALFHVSQRTISRLRNTNQIRYSTMGGKIYTNKHEIEALLDSRNGYKKDQP
jgi:hypothetical protein